MNREERRQIREREKRLKKQRKEYLRKEKESIKKQKKELREKTRVMRKKIRKARIEHYKEKFHNFIKNPLGRKKADKTEKILKQHVRRDIRYHTKKRIINLPSTIVKSIKGYYTARRLWFKNVSIALNENKRRLLSAFNSKELKRAYLVTAVNSTVMFLLGFLVSYFINQLVTVYTAKILRIPSELFSYRIYWPLYTYSTLYTRQVLILIFGMGPLVSFLLGILFFRLFIVYRYKTVYLKLFFLWASINSFILFFGAYITGAITRTGFIYASEWLFLNNMFDVVEIIFITLSVISLIVIGFFITKAFLEASNNKELIDSRYRLIYVFSIAIIPYIAGIVFLIVMNYPNLPPELFLLYLSPAPILIVVLLRYNAISLQKVRTMKFEGEYKVNFIALSILILLIVVIRLTVFNGIVIG